MSLLIVFNQPLIVFNQLLIVLKPASAFSEDKTRPARISPASLAMILSMLPDAAKQSSNKKIVFTLSSLFL